MSRRSSLANNGLHSWLYDAAHNALVWGDITLTAVKVIIPLVCCARRRGDQTGGALHRCSRRAVENGNRILNAAPAAQGLANGEGCRSPSRGIHGHHGNLCLRSRNIYLTPHAQDVDIACLSQSDSGEAGAPEIEVTPDMIAAGKECIASVWLDFTGPNGHSLWDSVLTQVFREMSAAQ